MTDDELAKFTASECWTEQNNFCQQKYECDAILSINTIPEEMCEQCALDWLKMPARGKQND